MGSVYRQPGRNRRTWLMKYYKHGKAIVESSGTDNENKARKLCASRETDSDRGIPVTVGKILYDAAAADLLADYATNNRKSTKTTTRRLKLHLTPVFTGWKMADITTPDIRAYAKARRDAKAARGTVNRELTLLKRMFSLAVQGGKLLYRPYIPLLSEHNVRTGFFEREQFESVRAHLPAALQPVVTFAYITGWRIDSEVLPLEWSRVDLAAREVRLDPGTTKNDEGRVFPMTDELYTVLAAQHVEHDRLKDAGTIWPRVFFRLIAKGRRGPKTPKPILRFNKAWKVACTLAGCPGRIPHDFRRTAVRNMVRRGVPERVAMTLTGHKTASVFQRYNIVSPGDLQEAATKLAGLGGK